MRAFMTRLAPQLALDAMTVSGTTLGEGIAGATVWNDEGDPPLRPSAVSGGRHRHSARQPGTGRRRS